MRQTSVHIAALSAATALVLAGCGGDGEPSIDPTPTSGQGSTDEATDEITEDGTEETGLLEPTEDTGDATEDGTDETGMPDPTDDTGDATEGAGGSGEYADVEASVAAWAQANADAELTECPLMSAEDIESAVNASGETHVSIDDMLVEIAVEDTGDGSIATVVCTAGSAGEDAAGIGVMNLDGILSPDDFVQAAEMEGSENLGPGPGGVGELIAMCEGEECVAFWYDGDLLVAYLLAGESATTEQVGEFANATLEDVLDAAANLD